MGQQSLSRDKEKGSPVSPEPEPLRPSEKRLGTVDLIYMLHG